MSSLYIFPVRGLQKPSSVSLVIFVTQVPNEDDFIDAIREYCDENTPPDDVVLLGPLYAEPALKTVQQSPRFRSRVPGASRYISSPKVQLLCFDVGGLRSLVSSAIGKIVHAGMLNLFRRHNGLIRGSSAFHYIKPSGKHCDAFLRTANVLVRGIEIEFIAACCISACPPNMTCVYTDTGAIHSIAFALLRMLSRFNDDRQHSIVDSFGSYTHVTEYPFLDQERALVLISASTSGSLINDLVKHAPRLRLNHIATVYFLGKKSDAVGDILCDLAFHVRDNPDGFDYIESYPADSCPLCVASNAVRMSDEQFIPQGPQVEPVLVIAKDAPDETSKLFGQLYGQGIIRANFREAVSSSASREVYLDLLPLFSTDLFEGLEGFESTFERVASHLVSANTKRIVHLNDRASHFFAGRIATFANQHGVTVDIVSAKALQDRSKSKPQDGGTTIVAASAMSTGRALLEVSKSLRFAQKGGAIKYVIAFSRPKDTELSKSVQRDLRFGENDPSEHHVAILHEFYFPSWRPEGRTSWESEYDLLSKTFDPLPAELEARCELLRKATSADVRGLSDELFLPSTSNRHLRLRPSFAFWDFDYSVEMSDNSRVPSQADVYATIVTVLHNLRNAKRGAERSLRQSDHIRRVISPRCFERFNDGIIQASFLRAAHVAEIDYSVDELLSEDMRSIVATILDQESTDVGEAANEFLLALALGRLRICPTHIASLIEEFGRSPKDSVVKYFWEKIRTRYSLD